MKKVRGTRDELAKAMAVPLVAFAVFNGVALALGLFEALDGYSFVHRFLIAALGGLAIASLIAFGWRMLVMSAVEGGAEGATGTLGLGMAISGMIVSAWMLAALIQGQQALAAHRSEYLGTLQQHAARVARNATLDSQVVAATDSAAVEVSQMAGAEASSGLISGIGEGRDQWARTLEAFAATLQARAATMQQGQNRRSDRLALFARTVSEARAANASGEQDRFLELVTRATRLIEEADDVENFAAVRSLGVGLMSPAAREQITTTLGRLADVANQAEVQWRREEVPFYGPVSRQTATLHQAAAIPGAWAMAVMVELFPLILLAMLLARPRDPEVPDGLPSNTGLVVVSSAPDQQRRTA